MNLRNPYVQDALIGVSFGMAVLAFLGVSVAICLGVLP